MRVVVLVPRREDHGPRDEIWRWLRRELEDTYGWPIYEGHHDEGPFCRSAAINQAARDAGDWDVALISDADCIAPGTAQAVETAWEQGCMTLPHTDYCYLRESATQDILAGRDVPRYELVEWSEEGLGVAQCVVRRDLYEEVGGLDERFVGHSWQDVAFHYACRGLRGQERIEGPLWHLWHPIDTATPPVNRDMALEYMDAFQKGRMKEFLASR